MSPTTDREEKAEEQKRGDGFLSQNQRKNLATEIFGIILLVCLLFALAVDYFVR